MNGSFLVVEAESVAAVREVLEKDPFWDANVVRRLFSHYYVPSAWLSMGGCARLCSQWDKEKIDIRAVTLVGGK